MTSNKNKQPNISYKDNPRTQLQLSAAVEEYEWIRTFFLYVCPIVTFIMIIYLYFVYDSISLTYLSIISTTKYSIPTKLLSLQSFEIGYTLIYQYSLQYPWKAIGILCLLLLTFSSYYALYWISNFLPTLFEPCYELRTYRNKDITLNSIINETLPFIQNKIKFQEIIDKLTVPITIPSIIYQQPYKLDLTTSRNNHGDPIVPSDKDSNYKAWIDQRTMYELQITENEEDRKKYILFVKYSDRLGNHLFQYIYSRLRAMYLDIAFISSVPLGSPFQYVSCIVDRWNSVDRFDDNNTIIPKSSLSASHECLLRARTNSISTTIPKKQTKQPSLQISLKQLLSTSTYQSIAQLFLTEPVCKYAMYVPLYTGMEPFCSLWLTPSIEKNLQLLLSQHHPTIKDIVTIPNNNNRNISILKSPMLAFNPTDICIHVRLGDILWGAHAAYRPLPMSYYRQSIDYIYKQYNILSSLASKSHTAIRIILVTEDANNPIILRMANSLYDYIITTYNNSSSLSIHLLIYIQSISVTADFLTLTTSPNIILSISSFVWWAAALNKIANYIIIPECGMFVKHQWQPAPRMQAHVFIRHDLTLPELRISKYNTKLWKHMNKNYYMEKTNEELCTSKSYTIEDNISIIEELSKKYSTITSKSGTSSSYIDFPPINQRSGTYSISLQHLGRWPGHKKEAIESLFD